MPVIGESCPSCGNRLSWERDTCLGCGAYVGAPNVREMAVERDRLAARFEKSVEDSKARGCFDTVTAFTESVDKDSVAVVNLWPDFLAQFLNGEKSLYSGYALQTDAETRRAAERSNDRERLGTEGILFGNYGPHIRYAALSLDGGEGLVSYGSCSVSLRKELCLNKATLIEENSYSFVRRHRILPGDTIPEGRRALWQHRHYLATAKLAGKIDKSTTDRDFAGLLLYSVGDRSTDEFIEVHVYGPFGKEAFVTAVIPAIKKAKSKDDRFHLAKIRDSLGKSGIPCKQV
ncbi:MAG: hypothetical protein ACOYMG_19605 [Candidatus Methylumidiphilus sp.]